MTIQKRKIEEETHYKIMRLLEENPDLTQRELAEKLSIIVGGVNYCLNAQIDKGLVKTALFQKSKNKLKYAYLLTPQGISKKMALTSWFLRCKIEEYDALKVEIESLKIEVGDEEVSGLGKAGR